MTNQCVTPVASYTVNSSAARLYFRRIVLLGSLLIITVVDATNIFLPCAITTGKLYLTGCIFANAHLLCLCAYWLTLSSCTLWVDLCVCFLNSNMNRLFGHLRRMYVRWAFSNLISFGRDFAICYCFSKIQPKPVSIIIHCFCVCFLRYARGCASFSFQRYRKFTCIVTAPIGSARLPTWFITYKCTDNLNVVTSLFSSLCLSRPQ